MQVIENEAFAQQLKRLVGQQQQRLESPVKVIQQRHEYNLQDQDERLQRQQEYLDNLASKVSALTEKLVSTHKFATFELEVQL